jgi:RimJ/RimL family protein N-acetyltransferase
MILRLRRQGMPACLGRGPRVTLREMTRADVDRWLEWPRHTDPLFLAFNPPAMSPRQRDLYYARKLRAANARQFSVDDGEGVLVGRMNLREIDGFARTAVLGVSFRPDRLGEGLGTEALELLLALFFERMAMNALFLDVAAYNTRARRCYERCGFRVIGEHWGEAVPDLAGIFRDPHRAEIRPLFRREHGLIRPLFIDMVLHRSDYAARQRSAG